MTDHDYKQSAYYLIYLIRCVLTGKQPSKQRLEKIDTQKLIEVAREHSLSAVCAYALNAAGIKDAAFEEDKNKSIRKVILLDAQRMQIFAMLEQAGIWYLPLKGVFLKEYYPMIGMRQMADNDVLFDMSRRGDVRKIMNELGFTLNAEREVVDEYLKEPVYNFEMHGELFMGYQVGELADYFRGIPGRMIKDDENEYGYHLSDEDFYLFMIAHEYKHYKLGGTGIRSLVDTFVFINKFGSSLDWEYISSELDKMGIRDYERRNYDLSMKLFGAVKLSAEEKKMLDYYIFSGTYGKAENLLDNRINEKDSKAKYILGRLATSTDRLKAANPILYKHKMLIPFYVVKRYISLFTTKRKKVIKELKYLFKKKKDN